MRAEANGPEALRLVMGSHEQPEAVHDLQVRPQMGEGPLSAVSRGRGLRHLPALPAVRQGEPRCRVDGPWRRRHVLGRPIEVQLAEPASAAGCSRARRPGRPGGQVAASGGSRSTPEYGAGRAAAGAPSEATTATRAASSSADGSPLTTRSRGTRARPTRRWSRRPSQRDVPVLLRRQRLALGRQQPQRLDDLDAGLVGGDHAVDVARSAAM